MNSYINSYIIIYKQNCYSSVIQTKANQTVRATKVFRNQNTKRFKWTLIYFNTDTAYANFRGRYPVWSHKMTLKQQINGQKRLKNERKRLILFAFSFYSLFGAWKIVGIFQNVSKTHLQRRGHPSRRFSVSAPFVSRHPSRSSVSGTSSYQAKSNIRDYFFQANSTDK